MGIREIQGDKKFPPGKEKYGETAGYRIYVSKETGELIIDTQEYHPGALYLSRKDLEDILKKLEKNDSQEPSSTDKPGLGRRVYLRDYFNPDSVREIRERAGLSRTRFAKILGVVPSSIKNWEEGRSAPSGAYYDAVKKFAEERGYDDIEFQKK